MRTAGSSNLQPSTGLRGRWLLPIWSLFAREVLRFVRQRNRVIGSLGTPILFWLVLGSGFGRTMRLSGGPGETDYMAYFFPGTIMLMVLFTAIFSSMSVIQERSEGFLQGVVVAPVPRLAIVLGKVFGGTALGVAQGVLMLALAPLAGLPLSVEGFFAAAAAIFLTSLGLSALGFMMAWRMDSVQGFHAVMNLLLMPMWLLSGALFPAAGASPWVRAVMAANPLTYGLTALRAALGPEAMSGGAGITGWPGMDNPVVALGVIAAFALITLALSGWLVSRPERG